MTSSSAQTPLRSRVVADCASLAYTQSVKARSLHRSSFPHKASLCGSPIPLRYALRGFFAPSSEQTSLRSRVVADCASLAYTQSVKARSLHRSSFPHKASLCGGPIPLRCALRGFFAPSSEQTSLRSEPPLRCALRGFFAPAPLLLLFPAKLRFAGSCLGGALRGVAWAGLCGESFARILTGIVI
jgi:hypothetical protein